MRRLPDELLLRHHCLVRRNGPDGKASKEAAYQQFLRLGQALWRQEQKLQIGGSKDAPQGAWIQPVDARHNFVSEPAWRAAQAAVTEARKTSGLDSELRVKTNLLSSQPLSFNLFGDLQQDVDLASRVFSRLLGHDVTVTRIEFEYSPGRGDPRFTGDHSAADVFVEYERANKRGCLAIEVKYHEDLTKPPHRDYYRRRYSEVAARMGCFGDGSEQALRRAPLEQLWRNHLLLGSILLDDAAAFDEGRFVLLYPTLNETCNDASIAYQAQLTSSATFDVWTLEHFVKALADVCTAPWVVRLRARYMSHDRVDHAWQDYYLDKTVHWARLIDEHLGHLQRKHAKRVQFRPKAGGVTMVGLLPTHPQLGTDYASIPRLQTLRTTFEEDFARHCASAPPGRDTEEKELQSFLVSNAQQNAGAMELLNAAAGTDFVFLTDEITFPSRIGDDRCDILAVRDLDTRPRLAVIELKSTRAMTELLRQTARYSAILDNHMGRLSELARVRLGRHVLLEPPTGKWVIWPWKGDGPDPRRAAFAAERVGLVTYRRRGSGFALARAL